MQYVLEAMKGSAMVCWARNDEVKYAINADRKSSLIIRMSCNTRRATILALHVARQLSSYFFADAVM